MHPQAEQIFLVGGEYSERKSTSFSLCFKGDVRVLRATTKEKNFFEEISVPHRKSCLRLYGLSGVKIVQFYSFACRIPFRLHVVPRITNFDSV